MSAERLDPARTCLLLFDFLVGHAAKDPQRYAPVLALQRPYLPSDGWKSGFTVAPQLGWRMSALSYSTTQMQQRLLPVLAGSIEPDLPITVHGPKGEMTTYCEAPRPRMAGLRRGATMAVRLLGAAASIY